MVKPTSTTDAKFVFDVLRAEGPVLVDFYADWCRSCRLLAPVLDELATDWEGKVKVVKLDVEKHPATADRHGIMSIPTLILFEEGQERLRLVDVVRRRAIEEQIGTLVP